MPRQARLGAPGTRHHVMVRGIKRGAIFRDDADCTEFAARRGAAQAREWDRILGKLRKTT